MSKRSWVFWSVIIDSILINLAIIISFLIRFGGTLPAFNFQAYLSQLFYITGVQLLALVIFDIYNLEEVQSNFDVLIAVIKAVSLGTILMASVTFFTRFFSFPRTVFLLSWFFGIFLLAGWRLVSANWFKIVWPTQRILIIGTKESGKEILKEFHGKSGWGYEVAGFVDRDASLVGTEHQGVKVLGTVQDIIPLIHEYDIDRIIVASPIRHRELLEDLTNYDETHVKVEVIPELYEIFIGRVDHTLLNDIPLVKLTRKDISGWVVFVKQIADILLSIIILIGFFPVWLFIAVFIKLTSSGSVFYTQERVGKSERLFKIYKFRTMYAGAEKESGPILADENDPRITPLGRLLRRVRLDEIPNIINILKGEMSFVGPRPERPEFVEEFMKKIPGYKERFKLKPGITGLAQVSGSYATTARNKLKYDLIYAYNQSLFLDLKIILITIKIILTGRGAR